MLHSVRTTTIGTQTAILFTRRTLTHGRPRFGQEMHRTSDARARGSASRRARPSTHSTSGKENDAAYAAATSPMSSQARAEPPSYLFRPFMGHSTRFAALPSPLQRADIVRLEREPLAHVTPGRVNDHICIAMVKTLRWMADRAFRERYIHRATMLVTVAAAAPAAGSVAAYVRMFFKRRPVSANGTHTSVTSRTSTAAEVASPFMASDGDTQTAASASSAVGQSWGTRLQRPTPNSPVAGAPLRHSYVDELRGLLAQSESHAVHYQILSSMAEITAVERALVLVLQAVHFSIYLALFLFYPRMGFRLMAYTAEESSVVWTQMVNDVDLGKIAELHVPKLALHYWGLEGAFTAQGALVPMVVTPKAQDVVVFNREEKAAKIEAAGLSASSGGHDGGAAAGGSAVAEGSASSSASLTSEKKDQSKKPAVVSSSPEGKTAEGSAIAPETRAEQVTEVAPATSTSSEIEDDVDDAFTAASSTVADPSASVFTLRDVVLLIRSDEMVYRDLNHEMANELDTQPGFLRRLLDRYDPK